MSTSPDYHGYSTEFDWDRTYFIPFLTNFCFYYKFIPLSFGLVINWLIAFKSPNFSKVYRRSLAFYHIVEFFFDIQHLIIFIPYPLFPHPIFLCYGLLCELGGPAHIAVTLTVAVAVLAAISLFLLIYVRMRTIVPQQSRFHLSMLQSCILMGFTFFLFTVNVPFFAVFGQDSVNKTQILQRSEFAWVSDVPGTIVYGEMFQMDTFNTALDFLGGVTVYGILFFPSILIYSAIALAREKKKIVHVKTKTKDNATKMLMIQLVGAFFTFEAPLFVIFVSLRLGFPTDNANVHSCIRFVFVFFFLINSMVCYIIHLIMNRAYQRIILDGVRQVLVKIRFPIDLLEKRNVKNVSVVSSNAFTNLK